MYIGNVILLILNLPLVSAFVWLLRIPYAWLVPTILIISVIGAYSVAFSAFDIWVMVVSGGAGYLLRKFGYEMAPLLLAFVLGDRLEENMRLAIGMPDNSYQTIVTCITVLLSVLGLLLGVMMVAWLFGYRKSMADEAESA
jgi:putative tricarboxylic transport membrane protein